MTHCGGGVDIPEIVYVHVDVPSADGHAQDPSVQHSSGNPVMHV